MDYQIGRSGKTNRLHMQIVEARMGPPEQWKGQCYAAATALAKALPGAVAVYGHYRGPVAPGSYFADRSVGLDFIQHGWVIAQNGMVLDPTRWVFEDREPYCWVGDAGEEYDRGGNTFRQKMMGPPPKAREDEERMLFLEGGAAMIAAGIFGDTALTFEQARWIAHLPPAAMGEMGRPLFEALIAADLGAWIPFDNRREVMGAEGRDEF